MLLFSQQHARAGAHLDTTKQRDATPLLWTHSLTAEARICIWGSAAERRLGNLGTPGPGGPGAWRLDSGTAASARLFMG